MLTAMTNVLAQVSASPTLGNLLYFAIVFFVLAIVAYLLGARGIAGMTAGIGRTLMMVFLVLFVVFLVIGLISR